MIGGDARRRGVEIETERLVLRLPLLDDAGSLQALYSDPEAMRFIGGVDLRVAADPAFVVRRWLERCGCGYATEAARAARQWAHDELGIERLISVIAPENRRSQRVAERLGRVPAETVVLADTGPAVVWEHPAQRERRVT